jgi:hypothetical protein
VLKPLFGADDGDWVTKIGRFVLNMGAIEGTTVLLVAQIERKIRSRTENADLKSRIGFIRSRFPNEELHRHKWAMNIFRVALKISAFRDVIAHSPLVLGGSSEDDPRVILGILDIKAGELISLEEINGRVDESAAVAQGLLEMQADFPRSQSS